jgi:hypothetical protein
MRGGSATLALPRRATECAAVDGQPARLLVLQSRPETTWRARRAERKERASAASGYLGLVHAMGAGRRVPEE